MSEIHSFPRPVEQAPPHSIEAEQILLGCLLLQPDRISEVTARGGASLFFEGVHGLIFKAMAEREKAGALVSPVTMASNQSLTEVLAELGGAGYLARLAGSASFAGFAGYLDMLEDSRGRRDLLEVVRQAQRDLVNGDETAADVAGRLEAATMAMNSAATAVRPVSMMAAATKAIEAVNDAYQGKAPRVVSTGINALDKMIYGFGPGEMALLGGRPSMGKTGVALSIGLNAARAGHGVVFASLEMTPDSLALRALSEATGNTGLSTPYSNARRGDMTEAQYRKLIECTKQVASLPIQFLPRRYAEPAALFAGVKQCIRNLPQDKLPIVIVDYLQLMQVKGVNRFEQITAISQGLKDTAMRLEVPVLALSQLSRAVEQREDKRPTLSDLRESGQLEQDADQIMFCYRDEYYLQKEEPAPDAPEHMEWRDAMSQAKNRLEIIVAKQRQGETGTARVRFNPAINLIWEDGYK